MNMKRILSAIMASAMMLTTFAGAVDAEPKTDRTVTTVNGTGYTVSSVGKHIIPVDDSSRQFSFLPEDGYDLERLTVSDGTYSDYALVNKQDNDLTLGGVTYPINYTTRNDLMGVSVITATISIPAAEDDVSFAAVAVKGEYTVDISANSNVSVSKSNTKVNKGAAYSAVVTPKSNIYRVTTANISAGGASETVKLSDNTKFSAQGFQFSTDNQGVLTISNSAVLTSATISLTVAEREPNADEVKLTVATDSGVSSDTSKVYVKKGENQTVSFTSRKGYVIDSLTLTADGKTAYTTPNSTMVFVGANAYRVTGDESACTLYLTDLQSDIAIHAESEYDTDHIIVETSAGSGIRITKDCASVVKSGTDVEFEIEVTDDDKYELDDITLRVGDASKTVSASATSIKVGGKTYKMETDKYGTVTLYVDSVKEPIRVSATATRLSNSSSYHNITIKSGSHLTISKNVSGSTVKDGNDVKFTIKPSSGYEIEDITLKIGSKTATAYASAGFIRVDGIRYTINKDSKGVVTLTVNDVEANVTISASAVKEGTATIDKGENGSTGLIHFDRSIKAPLFVGYAGGYFGPENNLTRAEAVVLLARMSDYETASNSYPRITFSDVPASAWYYTELAAFVEGGIVDDTGYFRPDSAITRADFVDMIYRLDTKSAHSGYQRFNDVYANSSYAGAVAYCADRGWLNGYPDGSFRPYNNITRAEVAKVVNRAMGRTTSTTISGGGNYFYDVPSYHWAYNDILVASSYQR